MQATGLEYAELAEEQNVTSAADVTEEKVLVFVRKMAETLLRQGRGLEPGREMNTARPQLLPTPSGLCRRSNGAQLDFELENAVARAELTSPLVGLGVHTMNSAMGTSSLVDSSCLESFAPQHVDPIAGTRQGVAGELWMGAPMEQRTWLLDSQKYYDGTPNEVHDRATANRSGLLMNTLPDVQFENGDGSWSEGESNLCHTSYVAPKQVFPGTSPKQLELTPTEPKLGPFYENEIAPELEKCYGLLSIGCSTLHAQKTWWPLALFMADRTLDRYAQDSAEPCEWDISRSETWACQKKIPKYFSAQPRVRVLDKDGNGVAGRNCTIYDLGADEDLVPLQPHYTCGPSGVDGFIQVQNLTLTHGETRKLQLVVEVDGVTAPLSYDSYWRAPHTVFYISDTVPSFQGSKIELIALQGHDAVRFIVLVLMLVFALNSVGMRHEAGNTPAPRPTLVRRVVGVVGWLWTMYYATGILSRMFGPEGAPYAEEGRYGLTAVGMKDLMIVPRSGARTLSSQRTARSGAHACAPLSGQIGTPLSVFDAILRIVFLLITLAILLLTTLVLVWGDQDFWEGFVVPRLQMLLEAMSSATPLRRKKVRQADKSTPPIVTSSDDGAHKSA